MFFFGKNKRTVNLVFDDYALRMVENNGRDLTSIKQVQMKPIPPNIIEQGKIVDEPAFYQWMRTTVQEWGIRNRNVRFYAPQSLVILRELELPEDVKKEEQKQYITMEIGHTIHFPFQNPIFDIYEIGTKEQEVIVLAAPEDELMKYTELLSDTSLKPVAIDIQPLGIYRYFLHTLQQRKENEVFMVVEVNLQAVNISIFHKHKVEFLRHQPLTIRKEEWSYNDETNTFNFSGDELQLSGQMEDQLTEIERLMNFYRFSIHQGTKSVTDLLIVGDSPQIDQMTKRIKARFDLQVHVLQVEEQHNDSPIDRTYIPALGLALKGVRKDA